MALGGFTVLHWSCGVLGSWGLRVLASWRLGVVGSWAPGVLGYFLYLLVALNPMRCPDPTNRSRAYMMTYASSRLRTARRDVPVFYPRPFEMPDKLIWRLYSKLLDAWVQIPQAGDRLQGPRRTLDGEFDADTETVCAVCAVCA